MASAFSYFLKESRSQRIADAVDAGADLFGYLIDLRSPRVQVHADTLRLSAFICGQCFLDFLSKKSRQLGHLDIDRMAFQHPRTGRLAHDP